MTPFDVATSAAVTTASLTLTSVADTEKVSVSWFKAVAAIPSVRSDDTTVPDTTWYVRMSTSVAFSSSVSNVARSIPASVNAWSVGAKTVNGPVPCRVATRFA